jgi:hypothetical protein
MFASGQKAIFVRVQTIIPISDIDQEASDVRFVPTRNIETPNSIVMSA